MFLRHKSAYIAHKPAARERIDKWHDARRSDKKQRTYHHKFVATNQRGLQSERMRNNRTNGVRVCLLFKIKARPADCVMKVTSASWRTQLIEAEQLTAA